MLIKAVRLLILCFIVSTTVSLVIAKETIVLPSKLEWQNWASETIFRQAQHQQRLILLDLTASWCQFCKKMDAITYHDANVIKLINQYYVAVRADAEEYPELAERYKKESRPLTIIFDALGNELIKRRGFLQPQFMVWMLEAVVAEQLQSAK